MVRERSLQDLYEKEIKVSGLLGDHTISPEALTLCDASHPTEDILKSDMLVVTTKAYDVATALGPFAEKPNCPAVLLLQNGWGAHEIAQEVLGPDILIYSSAMMVGMVRHSPTSVEVTAQSSPILCGSLLGHDTGPLKGFLGFANDGFVPMQFDDEIRKTILFKLLLNSCMNPIGMLTKQSYGELLTNTHSRELIVGLADETLTAFANAYNYRPAENGEQYVDKVLNPLIFPRGQGHHSSMSQDLQAGRKTEIDFLNGAIAKLSKHQGLRAIRHESVIQLIKACEAT